MKALAHVRVNILIAYGHRCTLATRNVMRQRTEGIREYSKIKKGN